MHTMEDTRNHGNHSKSSPFISRNQFKAKEKHNTTDECLVSMQEIINKLNTEDKTLRNTRRTIGFSQIVQKDLIPMIIHVQDNSQLFEHTIKLLNMLTIPVECLLPVDIATRTASEQIIVAELNSFLIGAKEAFLDTKATKAVLEYMKTLACQETRMEHHLTKEDCEALNSCLMLLRNILHIPEASWMNGVGSSPIQNQILWNLFSQGLDKILIQLITCKQSDFWAVTMVQLIALIYKDEDVGTLQKLLGNWLESSPSDSSEDDESNTSPHDSGCSASASTYEPNSSDSSSDSNSKNNNHRKNSNGGSGLNGDSTPTADRANGRQSPQKERKVLKHFHERERGGFAKAAANKKIEDDINSKLGNSNSTSSSSPDSRRGSKGSINNSTSGSDYGYHTQEKHNNTSSNDDDDDDQIVAQSRNNKIMLSRAKSGAPSSAKQVWQTHVKSPPSYCPTMTDKNDMRKRKLELRQKGQTVRLNKAWKLRVKGLKHVPTDDDISNLMKDFTVDFLLKGYSRLVVDLKAQLMLNTQIQLDQSHILWLVTYFLKFANQLELELRLLSPVLSCDIISYLTYEGVNTCEQLEKAWHEKSTNLKPHLRRIHLVVTAIKEFIQTLETYNRRGTLSSEDVIEIQKVQDQICGLLDLRQLFLLLIRYYNPAVQSLHYLQDLVITNHAFILLLERVTAKNSNCVQRNVHERFNMSEHIRQFATYDIMKQYGAVLEGFQTNSEFVNDCVFTMLHHVVGDLNSPEALFQPLILRCFLGIWENDYKVMDDWMDLMEFVIQKFMASTNKQSDRPSSSLSMESTNKIDKRARWSINQAINI